MKNKKENLTGYLFILPAIILFFTFVLIPVIVMVCLGFTKYNLFSAPEWTGFSNFARAFTDGRLWTVTKNTIFLAFFSVILNIAVGLFLALLIANKKKPCIQLFGKAVLFLSHDCGTGVYCCNLVKYSGSGWWIAKLLYSKNRI